MRRPSRTVRKLLATGAALALPPGLIVAAADGESNREGGVFRIAASINSIDPAITLDAGSELQATCAKLMNYPDKPAPAGTRIVPEVAARYPTLSRDGHTYSYRFRSG